MKRWILLLLIVCSWHPLCQPMRLGQPSRRSSLIKHTSTERYNFSVLGIATFNVTLGRQERRVSFSSSLNNSASVEITLCYFLEVGAPPTEVDLFLNDAHNGITLHPQDASATILMNATMKSTNTFRIRADIPDVFHRLTIYENSTLTLTAMSNQAVDQEDNGRILSRGQLQFILLLSIVLPLALGAAVEWRSKKHEEKHVNEEDEEEIVVM